MSKMLYSVIESQKKEYSVYSPEQSLVRNCFCNIGYGCIEIHIFLIFLLKIGSKNCSEEVYRKVATLTIKEMAALYLNLSICTFLSLQTQESHDLLKPEVVV